MIGSDDFRMCGSGRRHHAERDKPMAEETPAAGTGRRRLAVAGAKLKEVSEFVVTPAKAIRGGGVPEPAHRAISALDPTMILFNPVVQVLTGPVFHAATQHRPDGAWITVVSVCGDPRRDHSGGDRLKPGGSCCTPKGTTSPPFCNGVILFKRSVRYRAPKLEHQM